MGDELPIKVGRNLCSTDMDGPLTAFHAKNVVGAFYEHLAAYVLGAERWEGGEVYAYEEDRNDRNPDPEADPVCLAPDLIRRKNSTFIEVKGANKKSTFKIYRGQARLYDEMRRVATKPIHRPRVEYILFMHELIGMTKQYDTPRELVAALAQHTTLCVHLDLNIVLRFAKWCGTSEYGSVHAPFHYPEFYSFTSRHMKTLYHWPRLSLAELGLPVQRYRVRRWWGGESELPLFPLHFVGTPLKPFPIVSIYKIREPRASYEGPITRQMGIPETEDPEPEEDEYEPLPTPDPDHEWDDEEIPF